MKYRPSKILPLLLLLVAILCSLRAESLVYSQPLSDQELDAIRAREVVFPPAPGTDLGTPSEMFSVQVAAFASESRALALKRRFEREWRGTYVQRAEVNGRVFYRVRVGKYPTCLAAHRQVQRMGQAGYDAIIMEE